MADDKIDWDHVYESNYKSKLFWDIHWIHKARDLYKSAQLLEPELLKVWDSYREKSKNLSAKILPDYYQGAYFMLIAFAIENLFKAVAVRNNRFLYQKNFEQTKKFPKELQEHDLTKLAQIARLTFSEQEEDLMRRLSRSAIWYGRYPVPIKYEDESGNQLFSDGVERSVSWFSRNDISHLNTFILSLPTRFGYSEDYCSFI